MVGRKTTSLLSIDVFEKRIFTEMRGSPNDMTAGEKIVRRFLRSRILAIGPFRFLYLWGFEKRGVGFAVEKGGTVERYDGILHSCSMTSLDDDTVLSGYLEGFGKMCLILRTVEPGEETQRTWAGVSSSEVPYLLYFLFSCLLIYIHLLVGISQGAGECKVVTSHLVAMHAMVFFLIFEFRWGWDSCF